MNAICPKCKAERLVHRASFRRGRIPLCKKCGARMEPDHSAIMELRSRGKEERRLLARDINHAVAKKDPLP